MFQGLSHSEINWVSHFLMTERESPNHGWPRPYVGGISLTYDGGKVEHLELAWPMLTARDIRGTFFVDGESWVTSLPAWKKVAESGNEIGNGCLLRYAKADGSLPRWTQEMISAEIAETQSLIAETLGYSPRSFAFPWGSPTCASEVDYRRTASHGFLFARSGVEGNNIPDALSSHYLRTLLAAGHSGDDLIRIAKDAIGRHHWLIVSFSGIGSGTNAVDAAAHRIFLDWLHEQQNLLTGPMSVVGAQIQLQNESQLG